MNPWIKAFHKGFLEENNIKPDCLYNAYHTGVYRQNLPSTFYINKQ